MKKSARGEIAAFPDLFDNMEQLNDELGDLIRRTSLKLAVVAIPGSALLFFALNRVN